MAFTYFTGRKLVWDERLPALGSRIYESLAEDGYLMGGQGAALAELRGLDFVESVTPSLSAAQGGGGSADRQHACRPRRGSAAVLKALIVNGARSMEGAVPDRRPGWGRIDSRRFAHEQMDER